MKGVKIMGLWYECPNCWASLDPGERCDCLDVKKEEAAPLQQEQPQVKAPIISLPFPNRNVKTARRLANG